MGTEEVRKAFEELQGKERERLLKEYGAELQILTTYVVPKDHLLFVSATLRRTLCTDTSNYDNGSGGEVWKLYKNQHAGLEVCTL